MLKPHIPFSYEMCYMCNRNRDWLYTTNNTSHIGCYRVPARAMLFIYEEKYAHLIICFRLSSCVLPNGGGPMLQTGIMLFIDCLRWVVVPIVNLVQ